MTWAQKQEINKRAEEKGSGRGGKSGGALRAWSEEQSVFLQEKISAIHADPEALIQGGEGKRWLRAFSNALLPADPQTPQLEGPGRGLGSGVP